jgi:antibiotic biosynthesis monooxygenase (ABM) superfamily enzyme
MNKEPTLREKCNGLREWLHRPKTRFDIKDRFKALLLLVVLTYIVTRLLKLILNIA